MAIFMHAYFSTRCFATTTVWKQWPLQLAGAMSSDLSQKFASVTIGPSKVVHRALAHSTAVFEMAPPVAAADPYHFPLNDLDSPENGIAPETTPDLQTVEKDQNDLVPEDDVLQDIALENSEKDQKDLVSEHVALENSEKDQKDLVSEHVSLENSEKDQKDLVSEHVALENSEKDQKDLVSEHVALENPEKDQKDLVSEDVQQDQQDIVVETAVKDMIVEHPENGGTHNATENAKTDKIDIVPENDKKDTNLEHTEPEPMKIDNTVAASDDAPEKSDLARPSGVAVGDGVAEVEAVVPPVPSKTALEIESGDEDPPVVLRTDQFKLRPNGRGRGRGRGRGGRGGGKLQVETIEESDGEKCEQDEEQQEEQGEDRSKPVKRKAPCKAEAKAKSKASCKAKATSKPKAKSRVTKKAKHANKDNGTDEPMDPPAEDKEPKIVWELITKSNNKFPWAQDGQHGQPMDVDTAQHSLEPAAEIPSSDVATPSVAPVAPAEPDVAAPEKEKKPRARPGESIHGKSFARRACPKTSPAKDKWKSIKDTFGEEVAPHVDALGLAVSAFEAGFLEQRAIHIIVIYQF